MPKRKAAPVSRWTEAQRFAIRKQYFQTFRQALPVVLTIGKDIMSAILLWVGAKPSCVQRREE